MKKIFIMVLLSIMFTGCGDATGCCIGNDSTASNLASGSAPTKAVDKNVTKVVSETPTEIVVVTPPTVIEGTPKKNPIIKLDPQNVEMLCKCNNSIYTGTIVSYDVDVDNFIWNMIEELKELRDRHLDLIPLWRIQGTEKWYTQEEFEIMLKKL